MKSITCVVIEDHAMVRSALVDLLRAQPGLEVIGDAPDGVRGLALLRVLRPDVAVVDVRMPGIDGIEVCATARSEGLPTAIVLHSAFGSAGVAETARAAGAHGCAGKGDHPAELLQLVFSASRRRSPTVDD